jgi:hypothetical protein
MNTSARRARFRAILAGDACMHPASVHDPIAARIATDLGFETAMFAGSIASIAVLGAPDLILVTLTEFAEQARRICRAGAPPLMVDADHGYGNALNVMRTVQELETAGVAALTIEDTDLPRAHGAGEPGLLSLEAGLEDEFVGRGDGGARPAEEAVAGVTRPVDRMYVLSVKCTSSDTSSQCCVFRRKNRYPVRAQKVPKRGKAVGLALHPRRCRVCRPRSPEGPPCPT